MEEIVKIALTGGPCAGKSSAEKFLKKELAKRGWQVIFVPEVATRIIRQYGLDPPRLAANDREKYLDFQRLVLRTQLREEDAAVKQAPKFYGDRKVVIICDRGAMDGACYMTAGEFKRLIGSMKFKKADLRERRYEAVFHLVTAADGAETHYNKDNSARIETPEQAREADKRTQLVWVGHPHLRIIDNSTDFEGKLNRLLAKILKALGEPQKIETERKFLVHRQPDPDSAHFPVPCEDVEIRQVYLAGEEHVRLRCRGNEENGVVYYETIKTATGSEASSAEDERIIKRIEYWRGHANRDPKRDEIRKIRRHFVWKNQYFELDRFLEPARLKDLTLLEIELTREDERVELPPWLGETVEVTADKRFKNRQLAKRPE